MAIQQRLVNYATLYEESRNSSARTGVLTIRMPDMLNAVTQSVNGCGTGSRRPAGHGDWRVNAGNWSGAERHTSAMQGRQWLSANGGRPIQSVRWCLSDRWCGRSAECG